MSGSDSNTCAYLITAHKTIGPAISVASSGDSIIYVAAATCTENLTIAIILNIIGSGASKTIIDGGNVNSVVTISNANAHVGLSKLTIQHDRIGILNRGAP